MLTSLGDRKAASNPWALPASESAGAGGDVALLGHSTLGHSGNKRKNDLSTEGVRIH